ncbi:MAG: hypothetical protein K2Q12_02235 [Rickettsiales bacterium]|nr:hypothetical protein [Rickettsiales bacterium]
MPSGVSRFFSPNYNVNSSARLYQSHYENVWESERDKLRHPRLMDTLGGRFVIRLFSRGVLGAAFLTGGNLILEKYIPASALMAGKNVNFLKLSESHYWQSLSRSEKIITSALTPIASFYDFTVGKPIGYLFGKKAVTFRSMRSFNPYNSGPNAPRGRSYGEEAVSVTLDFALGSVGDSWGRRIAGVLDPNVKKSWMKDGHIDWHDFGKSVLKSGFEIFSYNQMEDWFAAIPYVYQMRMQRHWLDRNVQRGSRLAIENGTFGGAFQVDEHGKIQGDYCVPGALDLQLRFMGYNVDTLMFRDLSKHVEHMFDHRKDEHKVEHERGFVTETAKYLIKTAVKASTYMAPAVPFFWIPRVASARMEAPRIYAGATMKDDAMVRTDKRINGRAGNYTHFDRKAASELTLNGRSIERQGEYGPHFNPYGREQNHNALSAFLRPVGQFSDNAGTWLSKRAESAVNGAGSALGFHAHVKDSDRAIRQQRAIHTVTHRYFNNALSYTPYMIAKYETANWWDTPQMDASIYRVLDGLDHAKGGEIKAGLKDFWRVIQRKPVSTETEQMTHEPRGLINSQRQGFDGEDRRDGKLTKSFADFQRENKIARTKAKGKASTSPDIVVDDATAKMAKEAFASSGAVTTEKDQPTKAVNTRSQSGQPDYDVSRMQAAYTHVPPGTTLH